MNDKIFLFLFFFLTFILAVYFIYVDPIYYINLKGFLRITPEYFLPTLLISILALYVTSRNYLRKSGIDISATFFSQSDFSSTERYISSILLVNKKDKPVIINKIYLKLGYNIFVQLTGDYDETFVLKPYESLNHKLEPHIVYMAGMKIIDNFNYALTNKKIKKKIVLDTPDGVVVCKDLRQKHIIHKILTHYYTGYIIRHKGKFINNTPVGNNVLYFIEIEDKNSEKTFLTISKDPKESLLDGKLRFNIETLMTDEGVIHVQDVVNKAISGGILDWKNFKVHSQLEVLKRYQNYEKYGKFDLNDQKYYAGWFKYHVIQRIIIFFKNRKMKKANNKKNPKF
ncbi:MULTISPECIES: hypothetical protein [unclassified Acinetobacter]|uniref:hypothetical protein n=1 Tax=unclassified Acinetobacter TaxID=196816 RepID=UPI0004DA88AF|nr:MULTISPECIES: hypothetical protein [unclassified Acinetobacter]KEC82345.1 hypothetical protein DT74_04130 [Acinetobacter sp. ETR1]WEE38322.1 hypothetical protein PYV58_15405 [Acinetobacter sp. TAC-1]